MSTCVLGLTMCGFLCLSFVSLRSFFFSENSSPECLTCRGLCVAHTHAPFPLDRKNASIILFFRVSTRLGYIRTPCVWNINPPQEFPFFCLASFHFTCCCCCCCCCCCYCCYCYCCCCVTLWLDLQACLALCEDSAYYGTQYGSEVRGTTLNKTHYCW